MEEIDTDGGGGDYATAWDWEKHARVPVGLIGLDVMSSGLSGRNDFRSHGTRCWILLSTKVDFAGRVGGQR